MSIYIRDDLGHSWHFDGERIKCTMSELLEVEDNGYCCNSLEEGIQLLNDYGYITPFDEE